MTRKVLIVNLNLDPTEIGGCRNLGLGLTAVSDGALEAVTLHHAELRNASNSLQGFAAVVLGPQGTPFSAYDAEFLPWLKGFVLAANRPVLGVCGGMQALALAWGGRIGSAFGEPVGANYASNQKIRGPLAVRLRHDRLPAWLPAAAKDPLNGWEAVGGCAFESHVEQVVQLPDAFVAVADSEPTPVEAFAHRELPILASQFHPELGWDQGCEAGRLWLQAWCATLVS
ncbi:MAG: type 1 glutamine amidotransferase [Myxococcota bacterium]